MEIMLLGTVEVTMDGAPVRLAGERQKALIGKLALEKGKAVLTAMLLGVLWGESVSLTARTKLHGLVSGFRRMIRDQVSRQGDSPPEAAGEDYLLTRGHGYELVADAIQVDVELFDHLVIQARQAQQAGQREAPRNCWRGP
jgi:DNA-binding SARP family transcriptional activator